jgi:plastocyanin
VRVVATGTGGTHGFRLFDPSGNILITLDPLGNSATTSNTITLESAGGYPYVCTRPTCSTEHSSMFGELGVIDYTR